MTVAARRTSATTEAADLASGDTVAWEDRPARAAATAAIIVNATPIGMAGDDTLTLPIDALNEAHVLVDLVYEPLETPLITAARVASIVVSGIGMLVHQATLQVELWSGRDAPMDRDASRAVVAALKRQLRAVDVPRGSLASSRGVWCSKVRSRRCRCPRSSGCWPVPRKSGALWLDGLRCGSPRRRVLPRHRVE